MNQEFKNATFYTVKKNNILLVVNYEKARGFVKYVVLY